MLTSSYHNDIDEEILSWLLDGDVSIQYQVRRDLLGEEVSALEALQRRIEREGWGARFLCKQNPDGHWGRAFYQPKWTSTHYTLLDLQNLSLPRGNPQPQRAIQMMFDKTVGPDGAVNFAVTKLPPDVCVTGMALGYAAYFDSSDPRIHVIVDYLLKVEMPNWGWNCEHVHGATHSSLHTTISVLEGLLEYRRWSERGHTAIADSRAQTERLQAVRQAEARGIEFILRHRLYMSDHTGEVIDPRFVMLSYPSRWRYDTLRALDYFRAAGLPYDERMAAALSILVQKRRKDGTWPLQQKHPGQVHFDMEEVGQSSRWNTLRALRVLKAYGG